MNTWRMTNQICPTCGESYQISTRYNGEVCRDCFEKESEHYKNQEQLSQTLVKSEMQQMIEAQNKTTHAVRSLAITFVAAPLISAVVVIAVLFAIRTGKSVLMIIVGLLGVTTLIGTLFASLDELHKSKISQ